MIVVADTAPLNYLVQLDCAHFLPVLYGQVLIPKAVMQELSHSRAPSVVSAWISDLPPWVEVRTVRDESDRSLRLLDPGEREAIQLAESLADAILLIDDERARREAARRQIHTTGTLGVLVAGSEMRLFDGEAAFRRLLSTTTFYISSHVRSKFEARFKNLRIGG